MTSSSWKHLLTMPSFAPGAKSSTTTRELAKYIRHHNGIEVNRVFFDVQVKRIRVQAPAPECAVCHYARDQRNPTVDILPRTFIFGGKAAPGYFMAKRIIKLMSVADVVNTDPDVWSFEGGVPRELLRVWVN